MPSREGMGDPSNCPSDHGGPRADKCHSVKAKRATDAANTLKGLGGRMKSTLWTIGPYDAVSIVEAPDDETVTAFALAMCGQGKVRTTTMRAFDRSEMAAIFKRLG